MLVSAEDFNLIPYNIPNIENEGGTFPALVTREEELVLNKILGRLLSSKFRTGIGEAVPAQRWKDLRDGVAYEYNSRHYHFDGLKKAMVPYIHYVWTNYSIELNSGIGVVTPDSENSLKVSPEIILSRSWNDYCRIVGSWKEHVDTLYGYLYSSADKYLSDIEEHSYTTIQSYLSDNVVSPRKRSIFGI